MTGDRTPEPAEHFAGLADSECGEHRTVGARAWCYRDGEWCSPDAPCRGCELPSLRQRAEEAERKHAQALDQIADERRGRLTAEAAVRRTREIHRSHDCGRHVNARTPVPCVNEGLCEGCAGRHPCRTFTALTIKPRETP